MQSPLREIRTALAITQGSMAQALKCSQGHLSNIERGASFLSNNVLAVLRQLHFDAADLARKQRAFVEYHRDRVRQRLEEYANKNAAGE